MPKVRRRGPTLEGQEGRFDLKHGQNAKTVANVESVTGRGSGYTRIPPAFVAYSNNTPHPCTSQHFDTNPICVFVVAHANT